MLNVKESYKDKIIVKFINYLIGMIPDENQDETKVKIINDIKDHLISLSSNEKLDFNYEEVNHIISDSFLTDYNMMVSHSYLVIKKGYDKREEYFADMEGGTLKIDINGVHNSYILN